MGKSRGSPYRGRAAEFRETHFSVDASRIDCRTRLCVFVATPTSLFRLSNISDRARDLHEDDFPCKNNIPFSKRYGRVTRIGEFLRFFKRITGFFPFKDLTENYRHLSCIKCII